MFDMKPLCMGVLDSILSPSELRVLRKLQRVMLLVGDHELIAVI